MELLCPSCQQKLTIPDHSAGQLAKCPTCSHTFTAPELPATPGAAYVPAPAPVPLVEAPAPMITPPPARTDGHAGEVFPAAAPPPAFTPAPEAPSLPPGDHTHRWSLYLNASVLQGLAAVAVLAVFVLSFFPWVGRYPGGVPVVTQSAWQAAFGSDWTDKDLKLPPALRSAGTAKTDAGPGASGMLIVYVLLLIPMLLLTLAAVLLRLLPLKLPPALERVRPWRWGIVAAVALLALVFLVIQELSAFPLEARVADETDKALESRQKKASAPDAAPAVVKTFAVERGLRLGQLHRTAALNWATWLNALAVVCALLAFRIERRGPRPVPRVDVLW